MKANQSKRKWLRRVSAPPIALRKIVSAHSLASVATEDSRENKSSHVTWHDQQQTQNVADALRRTVSYNDLKVPPPDDIVLPPPTQAHGRLRSLTKLRRRLSTSVLRTLDATHKTWLHWSWRRKCIVITSLLLLLFLAMLIPILFHSGDCNVTGCTSEFHARQLSQLYSQGDNDASFEPATFTKYPAVASLLALAVSTVPSNFGRNTSYLPLMNLFNVTATLGADTLPPNIPAVTGNEQADVTRTFASVCGKLSQLTPVLGFDTSRYATAQLPGKLTRAIEISTYVDTANDAVTGNSTAVQQTPDDQAYYAYELSTCCVDFLVARSATRFFANDVRTMIKCAAGPLAGGGLWNGWSTYINDKQLPPSMRNVTAGQPTILRNSAVVQLTNARGQNLSQGLTASSGFSNINATSLSVVTKSLRQAKASTLNATMTVHVPLADDNSLNVTGVRAVIRLDANAFDVTSFIPSPWRTAPSACGNQLPLDFDLETPFDPNSEVIVSYNMQSSVFQPNGCPVGYVSLGSGCWQQNGAIQMHVNTTSTVAQLNGRKPDSYQFTQVVLSFNSQPLPRLPVVIQFRKLDKTAHVNLMMDGNCIMRDSDRAPKHFWDSLRWFQKESPWREYEISHANTTVQWSMSSRSAAVYIASDKAVEMRITVPGCPQSVCAGLDVWRKLAVQNETRKSAKQMVEDGARMLLANQNQLMRRLNLTGTVQLVHESIGMILSNATEMSPLSICVPSFHQALLMSDGPYTQASTYEPRVIDSHLAALNAFAFPLSTDDSIPSVQSTLGLDAIVTANNTVYSDFVSGSQQLLDDIKAHLNGPYTYISKLSVVEASSSFAAQLLVAYDQRNVSGDLSQKVLNEVTPLADLLLSTFRERTMTLLPKFLPMIIEWLNRTSSVNPSLMTAVGHNTLKSMAKTINGGENATLFANTPINQLLLACMDDSNVLNMTMVNSTKPVSLKQLFSDAFLLANNLINNQTAESYCINGSCRNITAAQELYLNHSLYECRQQLTSLSHAAVDIDAFPWQLQLPDVANGNGLDLSTLKIVVQDWITAKISYRNSWATQSAVSMMTTLLDDTARDSDWMLHIITWLNLQFSPTSALMTAREFQMFRFLLAVSSTDMQRILRAASSIHNRN